ncbi:MAG TPA: Do family serine endopeptidase [Hyphomicrobiaceae bacterium]|nr:Do family serine endopeptidase [Hyphomicrobiaceae bacterium]
MRVPLSSARVFALSASLLVVPIAGPAGAQVAGRPGPDSVANVAEKLMDSVVSISTSQAVKGSEGVPLPRVPKGSPFEEFFDDFFKKKGSSRERKQTSLGSGFVIDAKEGLIVTNNHVIDGADEITANFADGSKLKVDKVLGKDAKSDLALLKVTPGKKPLTAARWGSSSTLRIGDWVMAIGNPFGLGGTLTVGVISAKQRDINAGPYDDFLQTDAAINKGNSGGPLFNMNGEVIGVNTAIISPTGGSIGIGFAVPSDNAVSILEQLKQFGEARRGWLGVKIRSITDDMHEALGLKEGVGALIEGVTAEGPAAKAGIVDGDVVLKFDGKDVTSVRGLPRIVAQTPVGKEVEVEVWRKNASRIVKVVVGRLQEKDDANDPGKPPASKSGDAEKKAAPAPVPSVILGMKFAPLDDALRQKYGFGAKTKGVVVTEVDPASQARQKGINVGDLIVEAQNEAVASAADVAASIERVRSSGRRAILLRVEDNKGELRYVAVPLN